LDIDAGFYRTTCTQHVQRDGFDITFGSNYTLMSAIPDYGASIEVSSTF
tara:strand:- start:94 stop:240 length:147 start_codon:yes stop_codon:yes gene_type:complete